MVSATTFIGRDAEVALLDAALQRAREGDPATVLLGGAAGVGKSRLLQEWAARLGSESQLLIGGCLERGGDAVPYAPFTAALRSLPPTRLAAAVPGDRLGALPVLVPSLGRPDLSGDPAADRALLFEQTLGVLAHLAASRPTVLVIEDSHWAAGTTRDLLDFLVRNQMAAPGLLLIVTARSTELDPTHPLRTVWSELDRVAWVIRRELDGLTRDQVADQIHGLRGGQLPPPRALVDVVFTRSQGNPLFVQALLEEPDAAASVPAPLQDLLLAGVRRLPDDAREVVATLAVGGMSGTHRLVEAVSVWDEPQLTAALRAAVAGTALIVDGNDYTFRHALVRDAVYEDLLPGERARLHRRFAEVIAADPTLVTDGAAAAESAHHWAAAGEAGRALVAALAASAEARDRFAFAEELHLAERALGLWAAVDRPEQLVGVDRAQLLIDAATAASRAGEAARGAELATQAFDEVDGVAPKRAAHVLELRGALRSALGDPAELDDLYQAERRASDDGHRARILAARATRLSSVPRQADALADAGKALELARRAGDHRTEAVALLLMAVMRARVAGIEVVRDGLREARQACERIGAETGDTDLALRAIYAHASLLEALGHFEDALEVARSGCDLAATSGRVRSVGGPHVVTLAVALASLGRWDESLAAIDDMLQLAPPPLARAELLVRRGAIVLARGDADLPSLAVAAVEGLPGAGANLVLPAAQLELERLLVVGAGDVDVAAVAATVERAVSGERLVDASRFVWPFLSTAARLVRHTSGVGSADARRTIAQVRRRLRAVAEDVQIVGAVQRAHRLSFDAYLTTAKDGGSRAVWERTWAAWQEVGDPFWRARTLIGLAEAALADRADRGQVVGWLEQAADLADGLRASTVRAEVELLCRRAGIALPAAHGASGDDPDTPLRSRLGLTSRELEVLRHLADGATNQDVASALFISPKTVSVHVSRILAKLGLTNRTQAAALAHRLGLSS